LGTLGAFARGQAVGLAEGTHGERVEAPGGKVVKVLLAHAQQPAVGADPEAALAVFEEIADAAAGVERAFADIEAVDRRSAGAGGHEPRQNAHARGLAGAIWPQKGDDFTCLHGKRYVHDGRMGAVILSQALYLNHTVTSGVWRWNRNGRPAGQQTASVRNKLLHTRSGKSTADTGGTIPMKLHLVNNAGADEEGSCSTAESGTFVRKS
jgi:hypothetical protein